MVTAGPVRPPTVKWVLAILRWMSSPDRVGKVGARPGEPDRAQAGISPVIPSPARPIAPARKNERRSISCVRVNCPTDSRSEESRGGKEGVSTCKYRGGPEDENKKTEQHNSKH